MSGEGWKRRRGNKVRACSPFFSFTTSSGGGGGGVRVTVWHRPFFFLSLFSFSSGIVLVVARARHRIESPLGVNVISEGINYVGTRKIAISADVGPLVVIKAFAFALPFATRYALLQPLSIVRFHPRGIALRLYRAATLRPAGVVVLRFNHRFHDDSEGLPTRVGRPRI